MENLNTPITNKYLQPLNVNQTVYNNSIDYVSPIKCIEKSRVKEHEGASDESNTSVSKSSLQDNNVFFKFNNPNPQNDKKSLESNNADLSEQYDYISPIKCIEKSRVMEHDGASDESKTSVYNDPLQENEALFKSNNQNYQNDENSLEFNNADLSEEYDHVSPIKCIEKSKVMEHDGASDESNSSVCNETLQENEAFFKSNNPNPQNVENSLQSNNVDLSQQYDHVSPIKCIEKSKAMEHDGASDKSNTSVCNEALQENEAFFESYNPNPKNVENSLESNSVDLSEQYDCDSRSICSATECDSLFYDDIEVYGKNVNEILMELSQAVHLYIDKIKALDISIEWELSTSLIAADGITKTKCGLKGPLDPEEILFLKKRLRQFCEEYNINYGMIRACLAEKVSKFQFPNELRLKFIQYLCKGYIDDRNPMTVLMAITKLGSRKGRFSKEEESFLIDMYHNYTGSYLHAVCALLLNRHRTKIFRKIQRLKERDLLGSRPSSNNERNKLLILRQSILKNVVNRRNYNVSDLKYRINTRTWISIGREYGVSPALAKAIYICEIFPQIKADHPVRFDKFFKKLLYRIKHSGWTTWEQVQWQLLSSKLYDVGAVFIYVMLRKITMHCVPKEMWNSFKGCAEYLFQNVLPYFEDGAEKVKLNKILIKKIMVEV